MSSQGLLLGCSWQHGAFSLLPQATSSAHYLLDFCHIPDESLIIDELQ